MLGILRHRAFRLLFLAQAVALLGTGLLTVALGLLAFDLAGDRAGGVLGMALAIKMAAYVGLSPVIQALTTRLPRKAVLITADLVRAAVALSLPFVDAVWQIYALIFVLQAASASFTPTFQSVIPDILPDEDEYTRALSLSRLAYDIENLVSPALAGLLLTMIAYHGLFVGTVLGFLGSAMLVRVAHFPDRAAITQAGFWDRVTRGARIYLATPRLRGLLSVNLAAAATSAFVLVNTVVLVRGSYAGSEADLAIALAAYGGGSMVAALVLPPLLKHVSDRACMIPAAIGHALLMTVFGLWLTLGLDVPWLAFLAVWALAGVLYSTALTPGGRLLRRSSHPGDRQAVFTAHFALSHACWLLTYPLAGWAGLAFGFGPTLILLGLFAGLGAGLAVRLWPTGDPQEVDHSHPNLPADHPHVVAHGGRRHRHVLVIDDEHTVWPSHG